MSEPLRPPEDAPEGSVLIVPTDGRPLFRLLRSSEGRVGGNDFQPRYGKAVAEALGIPEWRRIALSHYLTEEEAAAQNQKGSRMSRVSLPPEKGHFARTGPLAGHVDVWARVEDLVDGAEIEE